MPKIKKKGNSCNKFKELFDDLYEHKIIPELDLRIKSIYSLSGVTRGFPDHPSIISNFSNHGFRNNQETRNRLVLMERDIIQTVDRVSLSEQDAKSLVKAVTDDLTEIFKDGTIIKNDWRVYGSYETGLCCKDSDIDFYNESFRGCNDEENIITKTYCELRKSCKFNEVNRIDARTPLITMKHKGTGKECNLTFPKESGIQNSKLMKMYLDLDQSVNLKPLILYLRSLLVKYELKGTNKFTTNLLFWLVVFFFQQKKLLPSVRDLLSAPTRTWIFSSVKQESVSTLLLDFFQFYRDFDFLTNIISPYSGKTFNIKNFDEDEFLLEARDSDIKRVEEDGRYSFLKNVLNLQSPSILTTNLGMSVHKDTMNLFITLCFRAYATATKFLKKNERPVRNVVSLPADLIYDFLPPRNLVQCMVIDRMDYYNNQDVIEALRKMMEGVLKLKIDDIYEQTITQIVRRNGEPQKIEISVIYLDYSCTGNTWLNDIIPFIFAEVCNIKPYIPGEISSFMTTVPGMRYLRKKSFKIRLICEINIDEEKIKIFIQGESRIVKFLEAKAKELLVKIFSKMKKMAN